MNTTVIYHGACNDGFAAAWAAWKCLGDSAEYIPTNYGDDPPDLARHEVYIVDFSYPRETLLQLASAADALVVLDHHKTAQADLEGLDFCTFDMEKSGAMLAWEYFCSSQGLRPPWIIEYVQDRDLWTWLLTDSKEVNAAITSWPRDFMYWEQQYQCEPIVGLEAAIAEGQAICRHIDQYTDEMCTHAINVDFEGHRVPCVNAPYKGISEICGKLAETATFSLGWFQRGDGKYQYSLRSRGGFDVAELARKYGGGGHKASAGFVLDTPLQFPATRHRPEGEEKDHDVAD